MDTRTNYSQFCQVHWYPCSPLPLLRNWGLKVIRKTNLSFRFCFSLLKDINSDGCYKQADEVPSPRFLKSHMLMRYLPREMLAKKTKVIYVARNPKDAAVSYYHFCLANKLLPIYRWNDFFEGLCEGLRKSVIDFVFIPLFLDLLVIHPLDISIRTHVRDTLSSGGCTARVIPGMVGGGGWVRVCKIPWLYVFSNSVRI